MPLAITGLLLLVIAGFSWATYREVRAAALETAHERLRDVGSQLAAILAQSAEQRLAETREVAELPAVAGLLADPEGTAHAEAREGLERLFRSSDLIGAVAVWDTSRALVLDVRASIDDEGRDTVPVALPEWAGDDPAGGLSSFKRSGGEVWFDVVVPVGAAGASPLGYLVQQRRISMTAQTVEFIRELIGGQTRFLVGAPDGAWTDLAGGTPTPPVDPEWAEGRAVQIEGDEGPGVGRVVPVPLTPWYVWVEFPLDVVLEGPRAFLRRAAGLGGVIVLLGALGGWGVSRRITGPLARVSDAADRLARGDRDVRVEVTGGSELARLARSFNNMADSLEAAVERIRQNEARVRALNDELEERVEERTRAFQESEERFRMLAATAHDAIVTSDDSGRISYFNPGAERLFGFEASEVMGASLTILMPERYRRAHLAGLARHKETGETRVTGRTVEVHGLRNDGTEFPVELSLGIRRTRHGPAFIGILRDITARKAVEEELRRYATELEATNRELEAFSYSVSHDLRAPLRGVQGFSQAVLEDYGDRLDEQGADYLRRVCAGAERMGGLIDALLELARATRTEMVPEPVDLSGLARTVAGELAQEDPDRDVRVEVAEGLTCEGDRRLLTLVLRNLLGNAWKFTEENPRAVIEVGAATNGDERAFFVRDDGTGFDMTYADKLFEPFQRLHTDREFSGTGIGLALVQRIIHRHGGRVWAEGEEGEGATFYFTLHHS